MKKQLFLSAVAWNYTQETFERIYVPCASEDLKEIEKAQKALERRGWHPDAWPMAVKEGSWIAPPEPDKVYDLNNIPWAPPQKPETEQEEGEFYELEPCGDGILVSPRGMGLTPFVIF